MKWIIIIGMLAILILPMLTMAALTKFQLFTKTIVYLNESLNRDNNVKITDLSIKDMKISNSTVMVKLTYKGIDHTFLTNKNLFCNKTGAC